MDLWIGGCVVISLVLIVVMALSPVWVLLQIVGLVTIASAAVMTVMTIARV